jgi:AAT family amino acid transporter
MIWLVDIWLVHHWFMDNWPGWKMVPKTAEEIAADHAAHEAKIAEVRWSSTFGVGLAVGVAVGVAIYFIMVYALPIICPAITIIT